MKGNCFAGAIVIIGMTLLLSLLISLGLEVLAYVVPNTIEWARTYPDQFNGAVGVICVSALIVLLFVLGMMVDATKEKRQKARDAEEAQRTRLADQLVASHARIAELSSQLGEMRLRAEGAERREARRNTLEGPLMREAAEKMQRTVFGEKED